MALSFSSLLPGIDKFAQVDFRECVRISLGKTGMSHCRAKFMKVVN